MVGVENEASEKEDKDGDEEERRKQKKHEEEHRDQKRYEEECREEDEADEDVDKCMGHFGHGIVQYEYIDASVRNCTARSGCTSEAFCQMSSQKICYGPDDIDV